MRAGDEPIEGPEPDAAGEGSFDDEAVVPERPGPGGTGTDLTGPEPTDPGGAGTDPTGPELARSFDPVAFAPLLNGHSGNGKERSVRSGLDPQSGEAAHLDPASFAHHDDQV
jgi:hypothetical protein